MSEFKCPEPDCDYQVGIGGQVISDEDFELQDSYFQEIEDHERMHEENVLEVRVRDLTPDHVGMQIEVAGSWENLQGFSHEGICRYEKTRLKVGLLRVVPEWLFLDSTLDQTLKLRKRPAQAKSPDPVLTTSAWEKISRRFRLAATKLWRRGLL